MFGSLIGGAARLVGRYGDDLASVGRRFVGDALGNVTQQRVISTGMRSVPSVSSVAPRVTASIAPRTVAPRVASESAQARSWAAQNGIQVSGRGRVPTRVLNAFRDSKKQVAVRPAPQLPSPRPSTALVRVSPAVSDVATVSRAGLPAVRVAGSAPAVRATSAVPDVTYARGGGYMDEVADSARFVGAGPRPFGALPAGGGAGGRGGAGGAAAAGDAAVPPSADAVVEEAIKRSLASRIGSRMVTPALFAGELAPAGIPLADAAGVDIPEPLENALLGVGALSGVLAGRRAKGILGKGFGFGGAALSGYQLAQNLMNPAGNEAAAVPGPEAAAPAMPPLVSAFPESEAMPTPEDEAMSQMEAIDAAYEAALAQLMEQYGSLEQMVLAAETGDPVLEAQLAQINAEYNMAQQAVAASYSAAIGDIEGYAAQADALMQEVAAQQAADFAAASGNMESMVAPSGATGASAGLAGASDTAVGGAGVTGAALTRALGGAASAQGAAARLATGTDLTGAAAAARAEQAAMLAGLGGQRASAVQQARMASAERQAQARAEREQNLLALRQAQGEAAYNLALRRAEQIAAMSPQDYAAAQQGSGQRQLPGWYGTRMQGDPMGSSQVPILVEVAGRQVEQPATIAEVNQTLDMLDAAIADVYRDPANAYPKLADFYSRLNGNAISILAATGKPMNAGEAYTQLFGRAPL